MVIIFEGVEKLKADMALEDNEFDGVEHDANLCAPRASQPELLACPLPLKGLMAGKPGQHDGVDGCFNDNGVAAL
jgi:hypothetical protein